MWTPSWINQKSARSLDVLTFQVLKASRKWGMLMSHVHVANEEKWQEPPRRDNSHRVLLVVCATAASFVCGCRDFQ